MDFSAWVAAAADLFLGAACHGCTQPGWAVCPDCRREVIAAGCFLTRPDPCPAGFPLTATAGAYQGVLRRLITAHKEHGALALTGFLAERLAGSVTYLLQTAGAPPGPVLLVPVPSAPATVRQRGLDATGALAAGAARRLRARYGTKVAHRLAQSRPLRDQAGLDAGQRWANVAGGLRIREGPVRWQPVVVVDDVVTTGASLTEAVRALTAEGVGVYGAATVAATGRLRPTSAGPRGSTD